MNPTDECFLITCIPSGRQAMTQRALLAFLVVILLTIAAILLSAFWRRSFCECSKTRVAGKKPKSGQSNGAYA
jgi:hypothetical protein